jgi:uncharacterized protein DUF642/PEP-CTERM motif-containing protein
VKRSLFLAPILVALFAVTASANSITNGSFEAVAFNQGGSGQFLGLTDAEVPGWHIPNSNGTYPWGLQNSNPYGAGPAAQGNQWIVLGLYSSGFPYSIEQTMTGLTVGGTYRVDFAIASETGCCAQAQVQFLSGSSTPSQTFTAPASGNYWTAWSYQTMNFVASASSVTISFNQYFGMTTGFDLGLDDVSVNLVGGAAVPEPASLILIGSGLTGLVVRARRRKKTV